MCEVHHLNGNQISILGTIVHERAAFFCYFDPVTHRLHYQNNCNFGLKPEAICMWGLQHLNGDLVPIPGTTAHERIAFMATLILSHIVITTKVVM